MYKQQIVARKLAWWDASVSLVQVVLGLILLALTMEHESAAHESALLLTVLTGCAICAQILQVLSLLLLKVPARELPGVLEAQMIGLFLLIMIGLLQPQAVAILTVALAMPGLLTLIRRR